MPDLQTALAALADTIKTAGYRTRTRNNAIEAYMNRHTVELWEIKSLLDDEGMENLYTAQQACGSVFVRPIIG
jgi:hypothetical protein